MGNCQSDRRGTSHRNDNSELDEDHSVVVRDGFRGTLAVGNQITW